MAAVEGLDFFELLDGGVSEPDDEVPVGSEEPGVELVDVLRAVPVAPVAPTPPAKGVVVT